MHYTIGVFCNVVLVIGSTRAPANVESWLLEEYIQCSSSCQWEGSLLLYCAILKNLIILFERIQTFSFVADRLVSDVFRRKTHEKNAQVFVAT